MSINLRSMIGRPFNRSPFYRNQSGTMIPTWESTTNTIPYGYSTSSWLLRTDGQKTILECYNGVIDTLRIHNISITHDISLNINVDGVTTSYTDTLTPSVYLYILSPVEADFDYDHCTVPVYFNYLKIQGEVTLADAGYITFQYRCRYETFVAGW